MANLFESVQLGSLVLANRVFMAPLTRNRADADGVPGELAATHYSQRASAGLIVTEATQVSPMGKRLHQYSRDSFPRTGATVRPKQGTGK
jgi:N-ethylmaleimide reductase